MTDDIFLDKKLLEELKNLTMERLKVMPDTTGVVIGSQEYSKADLLSHVSKADDLGKEIMTMQLEFLRDMASGEIYKDDNTYNQAQA